jgi:AraC family transcriptional regulator of adaptative response/methylated-DNA-[protein]-cysteine methyltransferase
VALVVPCHRVVGKNGQLTGYRWGKERKEKLLALEYREAAESAAGTRRGRELA